MYLLNIHEERNVVEVNLGGRLDAVELKVLGEEIAEIAAQFDVPSFYVMLDATTAKPLDSKAQYALAEVKDDLLASGAEKIVTIARDDEARIQFTTDRLQSVLEGREEFVLHASAEQFPVIQSIRHVRAA